MDRISELAAEIAQLQPEEKKTLFRLLVSQGDLASAAPAPQGSQQELPMPQELPRPQELPGPDESPSPPDYILTFDGGSKGNPGWGYGSFAITRVRDGAQRLERLEFGQDWTSNEAEYDSLIAALESLIERIEGADRYPQEFALEVRGDSTLVINQILGKWKAKDPRMVERRDRCRRLLRRFGQVEMLTQPREESVRVLGH